MRKRLLAAAAAALFLLCAGCSTTKAQINQYNAALYVRGVLDQTYVGTASDEYLTLTGFTAEEVEKSYQDNLKAEFSQRVAVRFQLDETFLKNDLRDDYMALLEEVYAKCFFTVGQATPLEGGRYCVEVSVAPVTFFQAAYADGFKTLRTEFEKKHPLPDEEKQEDMTAAQIRRATERFETLWAQEVYDYLYARLDAVTTGGAVTKLILVTPGNAGNYVISATDFRDLDDLALQY